MMSSSFLYIFIKELPPFLGNFIVFRLIEIVFTDVI